MSDPIDYEVVLLAIMIWREARGESYDAKVAVASTVMNRVKKAGWQGKTVVDVVTKKWQYSSMSDPNDRQLTTWPEVNSQAFADCLYIATQAVEGKLILVPWIDHYFDDSLKGDAIPKWAKEHPLRFRIKLGRLNFYDLDQDVDNV